MKIHINTPVIFFIFNRPDTTYKVFQAIRNAKPKKLYVFADGPRKDRNEYNECLNTRKILDEVDWDCEIIKKFSDINLGCKKNISQGLDYVFEREEKAIILEDDCLPNESFFGFCEELLEKYKNDTRIGAISGNNLQFGRKRSENSYYFSKYFHCWGWATWRRAWKIYDHNMEKWPFVRDNGILENIIDKPYQVKYWTNIFNKVHQGKINTWDYQFTFSLLIQNMLSITPEKNLMANIGFDARGTHTNYIESPFSEMKTQELKFPLNHPSLVYRSRNADNFTEMIYASGSTSFIKYYLKKALTSIFPEGFLDCFKFMRRKFRVEKSKYKNFRLGFK